MGPNYELLEESAAHPQVFPPEWVLSPEDDDFKKACAEWDKQRQDGDSTTGGQVLLTMREFELRNSATACRDLADLLGREGDALAEAPTMDKSQQSDLECIRQYITDLDAYAKNSTDHARFCERWNIGQPGMFGVLSPGIEPGAFFAMNRQFCETAAPLKKAVDDAAPVLVAMAARYGVRGGAFAMLNPNKPASLTAAREAALRLADAVCGGAERPGESPSHIAHGDIPDGPRPPNLFRWKGRDVQAHHPVATAQLSLESAGPKRRCG